MLARVWTGEAVAPACKEGAPLLRDFAARYRERRRSGFVKLTGFTPKSR